MIPIEIFEYKQNWLPGYKVSIHSDLRGRAKSWLKQLEQREYQYKEFTDNYEDTICFENQRISQEFASDSIFMAWVVKSTRTG